MSQSVSNLVWQFTRKLQNVSLIGSQSAPHQNAKWLSSVSQRCLSKCPPMYMKSASQSVPQSVPKSVTAPIKLQSAPQSVYKHASLKHRLFFLKVWPSKPLSTSMFHHPTKHWPQVSFPTSASCCRILGLQNATQWGLCQNCQVVAKSHPTSSTAWVHRNLSKSIKDLWVAAAKWNSSTLRPTSQLFKPNPSLSK